MAPKYHPNIGTVYTLAPKQGLWVQLADGCFRKLTVTNAPSNIVVVVTHNGEAKLTASIAELPEDGWEPVTEFS